MGSKITDLEDFRVVAIGGEGVAIVDNAGHYWLVYPETVLEGRGEDALAEAYREVN